MGSGAVRVLKPLNVSSLNPKEILGDTNAMIYLQLDNPTVCRSLDGPMFKNIYSPNGVL